MSQDNVIKMAWQVKFAIHPPAACRGFVSIPALSVTVCHIGGDEFWLLTLPAGLP